MDPKQTGAHSAGYSLLELIATLALALLLMAIAVPSFASLITKTRVSVQSNQILETLQHARVEAITRQKLIQICQIEDITEPRCSSDYSSYRDWSVGWMIFLDLNRNNNYDSSDEIIRVAQGSPYVQLIFNQRGRLRFFPTGTARSAGFTICDGRQLHYRHVYLLHTGRARTSDEVTKKQKAKCDALAATKSS